MTLQCASTRQATNLAVDPETQTLPRYLRRQLLRKEANARVPELTSTKKNASDHLSAKTFRSRHYDPNNEATPKSDIRLLEPHVLSARLKKLCDNDKVDDAILILKNAPLDAQNTQVWNTMIWETLKAARYSLAYQLYIDVCPVLSHVSHPDLSLKMKRRGFIPTVRTFQTMFNGLSRVENWSTFTKQLTHVKSLYEGYQNLVGSLKQNDPNDPDLSPDPLAGYFRILGRAGEYQAIFDVYYSMDKEGPMAPNRLVYTALFQAIHAAMSDTTEGRIKVAADARLLWSQMMKGVKKNSGLSPDSYTIAAAITALSGGNSMDHELAFKIVLEYYGLVTDKVTSQSGELPLSAESLFAVLRLCNLSKNHAFCTQFYQQVLRRPEKLGGIDILDRGHMEEVLKADIALRERGLGYHALQTLEWMLRQEIAGPNGPKIRPKHSTYLLVLQACWYSADWNSAKRAFDIMTGYHSHDFMDGAVAETPRSDNKRVHPPGAEFMSLMLRTALATRDKANLRQVLRIIDHLGYDTILATRGDVVKETQKVSKTRSFIHEKFKSALVEAVDKLLEEKVKHVRPNERVKFEMLAKRARDN